jgi:hypothetical protein
VVFCGSAALFERRLISNKDSTEVDSSQSVRLPPLHSSIAQFHTGFIFVRCSRLCHCHLENILPETSLSQAAGRLWWFIHHGHHREPQSSKQKLHQISCRTAAFCYTKKICKIYLSSLIAFVILSNLLSSSILHSTLTHSLPRLPLYFYCSSTASCFGSI